MVFYLKYRPKTISELDLESVRNKLTSVLKSDSLPHAFLFTGPKGLGKTSAARIVAKAINCEQRLTTNEKQLSANKKKLEVESIEPCNVCSACVSITNGSNIDVSEIDAASNRGIDEIRDLRSRVKFSPSNLQKKVYIIDEVHMLTMEAFNALLKTLEEPPSHVVFILATTESWKLPPTITSRTFIVQFEKPTMQELIRSLDRIIKGEGLDIEQKVLERVYRLSEGSFRDATKIIEELTLSSQDKKITLENFESIFKFESIDLLSHEFINLLAKKDIKKSLTLIEKLTSEGINCKLFLEKVAEYLHSLFLLKAGIKQDISDVQDLDKNDTEILLGIFQNAYEQIKVTPIPQLPLELAAAKWCIKDSPKQTREFESPSPTSEDKAIKAPENTKKQTPLSKPAQNDPDLMKNLIESVKSQNHSIAGILRSCTLTVQGNIATIVSPFKFHAEKLRDEKVMQIVKNHLATLSQNDVSINIEILKKE